MSAFVRFHDFADKSGSTRQCAEACFAVPKEMRGVLRWFGFRLFVVKDVSLEVLHAAAKRCGIPRRQYREDMPGLPSYVITFRTWAHLARLGFTAGMPVGQDRAVLNAVFDDCIREGTP